MSSASAAPVRVVQIPGDHAYVAKCSDQSIDASSSPAAATGRSPALDPAWLAARASQIELVHLHFGFEQLTVAQLSQWTTELARLGLPLVYTAHDLRNPHEQDGAHHDAQLEVLMRAAQQVLTLTPWAAERIRHRFDREALVVPHPPVLTHQRRSPRIPAPRVAGIHLKSLRRNIPEPVSVVAAAAAGAARAGAVLRVDLHPGLWSDPRLSGLLDLHAAGHLELHVHERFTDDALATYLAGLDVSVMPNRWGTHSGWLEACRDAGTRVVAPTCGAYSEQWVEVTSYTHDEDHGLDAASLQAAVLHALTAPALPAPDPVCQQQRITQMGAAHAQMYRELIARTTTSNWVDA